VTLAPKA
jgi:quinol monooxygenase YgiN